jgi:excisionase family DNA binding protein
MMRGLSAAHAADELGISKATVLRLYKAGQLEGYRTTTALNAHVRIFEDSIDAYKKAREQQPREAKSP